MIQYILIAIAIVYAGIALLLVFISKRSIFQRIVVAVFWLPIIIASLVIGFIQGWRGLKKGKPI